MNRRKFLKLSGVGTAGVVAAAVVPSYPAYPVEHRSQPKLKPPSDVKFYSQSGHVQLLWDVNDDS